mmetsp:Transcript_43439/g.75189  ORF Transcript_43439/g.75189 Transcript_43439/m.75189 type:complete len:103 (+) Transcript_43439:901-1209(+)
MSTNTKSEEGSLRMMEEFFVLSLWIFLLQTAGQGRWVFNDRQAENQSSKQGITRHRSQHRLCDNTNAIIEKTFNLLVQQHEHPKSAGPEDSHHFYKTGGRNL